MSNDFYTDAQEVRLTTARAELQNTERAAVEAAFDKLPTAAAFKTRNIYYAIAGALEDATYTVTLSTPTPTAYDKGFRIDLEVQVANTGASTINANGLGAKQIQNPDGTALAANTLLTGVIYPLIYNGTVFKITFEAADTIPADESVTVAKLAASIYADQSEAEAGTENTKLMTALRTKQGFTSYGMLKATYDAAAIAEQLVGLSATQTLTNKTLTTPTLTLKQGAAPTPTAEGDIQWDTDDDKIVIGDGAGQKVFVPTAAVSGDVTMDTAGAVAIAAGVIVNADVNASAAIALSKLAALTASRLAVTDGSGFLAVSSVTATEAGYLSGVTSAIQTQLDAKQASDAELTAIAGLTSAADKVPYFTGSGAAAVADFTSVARTLVAQATQALMLTTGLGLSANGASLVAAANYAAMRALLDLEAGTDFYSITAADAAFQPLDTDLTAIAGLTSAADKMPYSTGAGTWALTDLTAAGRALLDDAAATNQLTTLGLSANGKSLVTAADYAAMRVLLDLETMAEFDAALSDGNFVYEADLITCAAVGLIEIPADQDYRLVVNIPFAGTITSVTTRSAAGTCTATFKINTTALGGTANSVSTTEDEQAHASANAFVAGDDIVVTISSNSACDRASFTIKYTRTVQ